MTIHELRNYRAICAELMQKTQQLENDKIHVVDAVQTAAEFPYWKHTVPIEGDIYPYDAKPIRGLILRRKQQKAEIEKFVDGIGNYIVRRAVEVRYIEPCDEPISWEKTAEIVGYHGNGNALKQLVWKELKR